MCSQQILVKEQISYVEGINHSFSFLTLPIYTKEQKAKQQPFHGSVSAPPFFYFTQAKNTTTATPPL